MILDMAGLIFNIFMFCVYLAFYSFALFPPGFRCIDLIFFIPFPPQFSNSNSFCDSIGYIALACVYSEMEKHCIQIST